MHFACGKHCRAAATYGMHMKFISQSTTKPDEHGTKLQNAHFAILT
jgi:hypothetical protein